MFPNQNEFCCGCSRFTQSEDDQCLVIPDHSEASVLTLILIGACVLCGWVGGVLSCSMIIIPGPKLLLGQGRHVLLGVRKTAASW